VAFLGDTPGASRMQFLSLVDHAVEILRAERKAQRKDMLRAVERVATGRVEDGSSR
jgi:hypothetical protein